MNFTNRIMANFSKRLVESLEKKGFTSTRSRSGVDFSKLAKAVDCSNQMTRKYALGQALPDAETVLKIAHYLDVSPGWLLFGENTTVSLEKTQSELIGIDYELLRYILTKIIPLVDANNTDEVINFTMDIVYDASHLNAELKTILKIIDMSISSAKRFQKVYEQGKENRLSAEV